MRRILLLCVALLALPAGAATTWPGRGEVVGDLVSTGRVVLRPSGADIATADLIAKRTYVPQADGGSLLRDLLDKPMPGPKGPTSYPVSVGRVVTGRALARAMARAMPVISTAVAVKEVMDEVGCTWSMAEGFKCGGAGQMVSAGGASYYQISNFGAPVPLSGLEAAMRAWVSRYERPTGNGTGEGYRCIRTAPAVWDTALNEWQSQNAVFSCTETGGSMSCVSGATPAACAASAPWVPVYTVKSGQVCTGTLDSSGTCIGEAVTKTEDQVVDIIDADTGTRPKLPAVAPEIDHAAPGAIGTASGDYDSTPETGPGGISGPAVLPGGRVSSTTNPDGSTTVVDRDHPITYIPATSTTGPGWEWGNRDTTTTYPPGTVVPPYVPPDQPPVTDPPGTTTTTTTTNVTQVDVETCGLPGTPPCKIDESGTPAPPADTSAADAEGVFGAIKSCVLSPSTCVPALPSLNWAFALPSHCGPIATPAFEPYLTQIDVCPYQPVFHDLMTLVWSAAGLFGAVTMVMRDAVGS